MSAWLETVDEKRIPLQGACLIGRSSNCQVVLPDTCISRRHTLIQQQNEDEYWLVDLGSSNGTRLNGKRLSQPCRLKPRDSIRIHTFEFRFGCVPRVERLSSTSSLGVHAEATQRLSKMAIETVNCWLLLADIDGSTRLSQSLPSDEWPQIVGSWLLHCRDEIEAVGGTVNKYLGDGLFAYLLEGPDSAPRIRKLMMKLAALQAEHKPPFHVVLHYGWVTMGGVSAGGEESLLGPEVNFAFRLEKVAGKLQAPLALSSNAQMLWPEPSELKSLGAHAVPSFDGTFEVFALTNLT
jgi:adenylate cyclase